MGTLLNLLAGARVASHAVFWFALSYLVIQLGVLFAGVVNGRIMLVL